MVDMVVPRTRDARDAGAALSASDPARRRRRGLSALPPVRRDRLLTEANEITAASCAGCIRACIDLSLGRIERLLADLGSPQERICRRSSMSPAPTARARRSPSCGRCSRRRASACMSTPRRISCASTSASASRGEARRRRIAAGRARRMRARQRRRSRSRSSRSPPPRRFCCSARPRPTICCSKSALAGASTRPM